MGEKDIYLERLSEQLDGWKAEILALEMKAETGGDEVKASCEEALSELKNVYEATQANVGVWIESADDSWDVLEANVEGHIESATSALKSAIQHMKTLIG